MYTTYICLLCQVELALALIDTYLLLSPGHCDVFANIFKESDAHSNHAHSTHSTSDTIAHATYNTREPKNKDQTQSPPTHQFLRRKTARNRNAPRVLYVLRIAGSQCCLPDTMLCCSLCMPC